MQQKLPYKKKDCRKDLIKIFDKNVWHLIILKLENEILTALDSELTGTM